MNLPLNSKVIFPEQNEIISTHQNLITDPNEIAQNIETIKQIKPELISEHKKNNMSSIEMQIEYFKCKASPLYFIENYVSVPVPGGRIAIRDSEQWNMTNKYRILIELFHQHDAVLYMSSRQSGKTTSSALYLLWCMIFFPKLKISYLTLDSTRAMDMIERMKEMMDSIPKWLQVPSASKAEKLTYLHLKNGSKISASFVSGSNDPDKVGRGLSNPLVFIDETAFIPHAEVVWGAMQPSISAAKIFAKKFGYPNGIIFTSTPNGAGDNFFYGIYQNSTKFDDIYDYENKTMYDGYEELLADPERNNFVSLRLHWSEFRSQEWYEQQKRELNFNTRKINQELDLNFLGSANSLFEDEIIAKLIPKRAHTELSLPFGNKLKLFTDLDPNKIYYMGVDTAMSAGPKSDFSAIAIIDAKSGQQVGEWKGKFSVVKRFASLVKATIKGLCQEFKLTSDNLLVVIERNSIGKETVEELLYTDPIYDPFNYQDFLYKEQVGNNSDDWVYGFWTSNGGSIGNGKRDEIFNEIMSMVNLKPEYIHGDLLIEELRNLENKANGRIEASKNQHDDVVMAYGFILWVRKTFIKKNKLIIDSSQLAYGLTADTMKDYLDVTLGSDRIEFLKREIGSEYSGVVFERDEDALIEQINKKSYSDRNFSFDSYIIM
jgi:hypothetical protein